METNFLYEHVREKTNNFGSDQIRPQTRLYSHRRWLEAGNFGFRKKSSENKSADQLRSYMRRLICNSKSKLFNIRSYI